MGNVFAGKSEVHGIGVFASRPFDAGETVLVIDDSRVVDADHPLRPERGERSERCRKTIVSSFFELPGPLQREYLPLLDEWFVEEHRERVEMLRSTLD